MLELFGGQLTLKEILHDMTFKEAVQLRDVRIKRKIEERKEIEKEREKELAEQNRAHK